MSRRYALQPLLDAAGLSMSGLRELVSMNGPTYRNARTVGLTESQADRWCCRCGLVPWLVWPDWLSDLERECEEQNCPERFVPRNSDHRFCSRRCGNRDRTRRHLAEKRKDPAFREAERLRRAANYAETREYEARRQRLLWATDPRFRRVKRTARKRWRENPENRARENARARERYQARRASQGADETVAA